MLRPLSHHTSLVYVASSSFNQNALFSTGLGRGSMDQITLGGKSISLSQRLRNNSEVNGNKRFETKETKVTVRPGQFDDAIEEGKKTFQSLAEPIQEPLKQMYEEYKSSSPPPPLIREGSANQRKPDNNRGTHKTLMNNSSRNDSKMNQRNRYKRKSEPRSRLPPPRQTDFVVQDINWSNFINSSTNKLVPNTLENSQEEQAAKRLELEGGDYDRYLSFPKSMQGNFNLDNNLSNSLQKVIGQNPSYNLSEKKMFYEALLQNLKSSTPVTTSKK
ncbi:6371_t:CDS:1 [Funneliformis geosporum]|uniref:3823_t:CDS:1 n=1 Tax=Funneliformis geosporum TaxID=1117311 RepID=A0A9W4SEP7_9GLOM|nr:6371_t:CDS:1 [Funneliformis geosporum]CAI2166198.1 3823_t:CDS:1 [Funneliformis geosporum]